MASFMSALSQIWDFLIDIFTKVFTSYTTIPVFIAVFALWVLDRIFHIFDYLKGR